MGSETLELPQPYPQVERLPRSSLSPYCLKAGNEHRPESIAHERVSVSAFERAERGVEYVSTSLERTENQEWIYIENMNR